MVLRERRMNQIMGYEKGGERAKRLRIIADPTQGDCGVDF
jgi:hypothetical protein